MYLNLSSVAFRIEHRANVLFCFPARSVLGCDVEVHISQCQTSPFTLTPRLLGHIPLLCTRQKVNNYDPYLGVHGTPILENIKLGLWIH